MPPRKKQGRIIPNLHIKPISTATPVDIILEADVLVDLVHSEVLPAIEQALKTRKTVATLFQINSTDAYLELPRASWINAIDKSIAYNSQKERYELCNELTTLKSKLNKSVQQAM